MKKEKFSILVSSPLDSGYVQNLSFKAGYHWISMEQKPKHTNAKQLFFHPDKAMAQSSSDNAHSDTKTTYSFPEDALAIQKLFNTPEYKVGDYVVLRYNEIERWGKTAEETKFSESTQKIRKLPVISNEETVLFEGIECSFLRNDVARHATEEEIKAYEDDDIYIGGYKVEFNTGLENGIKVGCVNLNYSMLIALKKLFDFASSRPHSFYINKKGVWFADNPFGFIVPEGEGRYQIKERKFNKILKKAGIK